MGLRFDQDGFLQEPAQWNEDVALELARQEGFDTLTDSQWELIRMLREYYQEHGTAPAWRSVCDATNQSKRCLEEEFHNRPLRAWRIAGLPNPGEEAKAYM